ncbi:hypothetical protein [Streptomyces capitiformicae]|nr:hypothetical protein [Streptomyces capitiformicae]
MVGTVAACTVTATHRGLRLRTRGRRHHTLDWNNLQSFGPDAVAVEKADRVRNDPRERSATTGSTGEAIR